MNHKQGGQYCSSYTVLLARRKASIFMIKFVSEFMKKLRTLEIGSATVHSIK